MLEIRNLYAEKDGKKILKGVNLNLEEGKIHVLMGPNGSGKTTLANVLMGNPKYKVTGGKILFNGKNILKLDASERAKDGLFMSFQIPVEISGITLSNFLRQSYISLKKKKMSFLEFSNFLKEKCRNLEIDSNFLNRNVNEGFSGGEKKKSEVLQMLVLNPKIAIIDEVDSGLDIDSLRVISRAISEFKTSKKIIILITHYKRVLDFLNPEKIYVMKNGRIVKEGDEKIVEYLEKNGYGWIK